MAKKAKELLEIITENPFIDPPPFEALVGDLKGAYSRRINIQHRLVYSVVEGEGVIRVLRLPAAPSMFDGRKRAQSRCSPENM